ncbi:MAG: NAD(P)/FAD-dependent oxidoreductase [Bacteroidota bacterium]
MNAASKIGIIGAGVSGLVSAIELEKAGYAPLVFEKTDRVGGRVKSDEVGGAMFDHGFQVLLTQYPAAKTYLNYERLQLQRFVPGAMIFKNGKRYSIGDPLRDASFFWSAFVGAVGTLSDKLKSLQLSNQVKKRALSSIFAEPEITTLEYLKNYGFSQQIIDHFFAPFFSGIFLETQLATSCRMFLFVYKMFSEGDATIPAKGMQAIPDQLRNQLQRTEFRFNCEVESIDNNTIHLKNGNPIEVDLILVATEASSLLSLPSPTPWKSCTSLYFKSSSATFNKAIIGLVAHSDALINNVFCLNDLTHYQGEDRICCATIVRDHSYDEASLIAKVKSELDQYCQIKDAEWIKTYTIPKALPQLDQLQYLPKDEQLRYSDSIFLSGDHLANGSLNAAMESGKRAAELMIEQLNYQ